MKDFANASFPPDTIALMMTAMDNALAKLPRPVVSAHVNRSPKPLCPANAGERDPAALQRMAFLELMIAPRG
jgi:hypothetical protein